ncbi:MAG TPA: DUF6629 family protein [Longimicrobiaceae bacterium]|nr:DUF6629 family protein [Longimicrobiaceae bacterium]
MCFSATASFAAGATLTVVGVASLASTRRRSELPFAAIPLLFGAQQLVEGVIWLTFRHEAPLLRQVMTYVYSMFSHVLWPIYVPLALYFLEGVPWRRKVLLGFQVLGTAVGLYLLYFLIARPIVAEVIGRHIVYVSPHFYIVPVTVAYVAATCFSEFFSSHTFARLFGVLTLLSFIATYLFYTRALISVWCFFAALLSVLIFCHLRFRQLGGFPRAAATDASQPLRAG